MHKNFACNMPSRDTGKLRPGKVDLKLRSSILERIHVRTRCVVRSRFDLEKVRTLRAWWQDSCHGKWISLRSEKPHRVPPAIRMSQTTWNSSQSDGRESKWSVFARTMEIQNAMQLLLFPECSMDFSLRKLVLRGFVYFKRSKR